MLAGTGGCDKAVVVLAGDNDCEDEDDTNDEDKDEDDKELSLLVSSSLFFSNMKSHINGSTILQNDCRLFQVLSILGGL